MKYYLALFSVVLGYSAVKADNQEQVIPIVIIGSGPAGLTAAHHSSRSGYEVAVISSTRGRPGGTGEGENMPAVALPAQI